MGGKHQSSNWVLCFLLEEGKQKSPHFLDQELRQTDELCYITGKKDGTFESGILTKTASHKPWISNGLINRDSRSFTVTKAKKTWSTIIIVQTTIKLYTQ